jgi:hypothetical integral membrane protein (TIGR02206 family)
MTAAPAFDLFGPGHLLTMAVLVLVGFVIVYGSRRWAGQGRVRAIGTAIGVYMIVQECVDRACHHFLNHEPITQVLPLHLCGASVVLTAVMLINHSRFLYEIMYFWGLAGASASILTPDIKFAFPHILYITYFFSHALIIIGVLFMTVNYGYRPTWRSCYTTFIFTNVYGVFIIPVNLLLNTNYLFICHKPDAATPLDYMGPWPWYIVGAEPLAFLVFLLLYSPYLIGDYLAARRRDRRVEAAPETGPHLP